MLSPIKINKKGISIMIGYILLITMAIVMGTLVYTWIKTYVPKTSIACPDGVSLFIKNVQYDCTNFNFLNLTFKNNGRFSVTGYFIYATNEPEQELPSIDLTPYLDESLGGIKFNTGIKFHSIGENTLLPGKIINQTFYPINSSVGRIYLIEIIPTRFQDQDNKKRLVSCSSSRIREKLICP